RPVGDGELDLGELRLQLDRAGRDVRVPPRRSSLGGVLDAEGLQLARRRRAHLRRALEGRGGERRRDPGAADVDGPAAGRPDPAGNVDPTPATATWTVQAASNDMFANAAALSGPSGTVSGTTVGMTKEPGETNHAGNAGGHSVWYAWTAPSAGSVTIDTIGSSF